MRALLRAGFRGLSAIAPSVAANVASRLWFRIPKATIKEHARAFLATGERFELAVDGRRVAAWRWGSGPPVILVHGWGGLAAQYQAVIEELVRRGMQAVTFDAPSHGSSDAGALGAHHSTLFEFADALREAARLTPNLAGIVAHSGGCAATAWALSVDAKLAVPRLVFVAPFGRPLNYMRLFQRELGLSDAALARFKSVTEARFGFRWVDLELPEMAARMTTPPLLVIHDREDRETAWQDGADIAAKWPRATLMTTTGLGHNRILRDATVVDTIADFLATATVALCLALLLAFPSVASAQLPTPPAAAQNPSPMAEETRAHQRIAQRDIGGSKRSFAGPAEKPVELWIPDDVRSRDVFDLVIHFHGTAWLPQQAVAELGHHTVAAVLNLGTGSGAYQRPFNDPATFDSLLAAVAREVSAATQRPARIGRLTLVGYSAGHGAVRAILREPRHFARVDAVLLLDGMHTSYVPEGVVVANGGTLDTTNLAAFAAFARAAVRGDKRFVVTHSEIFPGTFASTTETADWLLHALGLRRTPVLRWGPVGMQELSEARAGRFELLGFAGNTAPDHVDQLHAMPAMLARLLK